LTELAPLSLRGRGAGLLHPSLVSFRSGWIQVLQIWRPAMSIWLKSGCRRARKVIECLSVRLSGPSIRGILVSEKGAP
jgi:hypothetical protein